MSVPVDPDRLRHELAIRGLSAISLARKARLSPATVSAALAGKPIAEASLDLIREAVETAPVSAFLERIIATERRPSWVDQPPPAAPTEEG